MNKTSFIKTLVIATLMFAVFPSHSSADHSMGSYFQAVVLSQEQSPKLNVRFLASPCLSPLIVIS